MPRPAEPAAGDAAGRVLFLSAFVPSLVSSAGGKTAFHEMVGLQRRFPLRICFFHTRYEARFVAPTLADCRDHGLGPVQTIRLGRFLPLLWALLLFWLPASYVRRFSPAALFALWRRRDRLVYVRDGQALLLGVVLGKLLGAPVISSQADVLVQMSRRSRDGARSWLGRGFWAFEHAKLRFWEPFLLRRCRACLVQSGKDADMVRAFAPAIRVDHFQPYLSSALRYAPARAERMQVLFWGAMNRKENEDAALYYAERIHPQVLARFPDYRFVIAGISPSAQVQALAGPSIEVTGFLEDPSAVFNTAWVAVVPLRMGAGIKVKTLECLMMGLPTVATPIGAEGIDLGATEGLHVHEDETALVEAILRLLDARAFEQSQWIRGQVLDRFSFDHSIAIINATIQECVDL